MGTDGAPLGAVELAVLLFLLSLRRVGERAGRMAERLQNKKNADAVQRRILEAAARSLVLATSWLSDCATVVSDQVLAVCPPALESQRRVPGVGR